MSFTAKWLPFLGLPKNFFSFTEEMEHFNPNNMYLGTHQVNKIESPSGSETSWIIKLNRTTDNDLGNRYKTYYSLVKPKIELQSLSVGMLINVFRTNENQGRGHQFRLLTKEDSFPQSFS